MFEHLINAVWTMWLMLIICATACYLLYSDLSVKKSSRYMISINVHAKREDISLACTNVVIDREIREKDLREEISEIISSGENYKEKFNKEITDKADQYTVFVLSVSKI